MLAEKRTDDAHTITQYAVCVHTLSQFHSHPGMSQIFV